MDERVLFNLHVTTWTWRWSWFSNKLRFLKNLLFVTANKLNPTTSCCSSQTHLHLHCDLKCGVGDDDDACSRYRGYPVFWMGDTGTGRKQTREFWSDPHFYLLWNCLNCFQRVSNTDFWFAVENKKCGIINQNDKHAGFWFISVWWLKKIQKTNTGFTG